MAATRDSWIPRSVLILIIVLGLSSAPTHAKYGGGTGEPHDPYLIYTAKQMNAIGAEPNDWDKHFRLMADIDLGTLGDTQFNIIGAAPEVDAGRSPGTSDDGFTQTADDASPIGPFTGVFDGGGHTVSNFVYTMGKAKNVGLFGVVADPNAEIRNLRLIAPRIDRWGDNVGSLVGHLVQGTLLNCHAEDVEVNGHWGNAGGLVGQTGSVPEKTSATVRNCSCTGRVYGQLIGGLVGSDWTGAFYGCFLACEVSSEHKAGGLAGYSGGSRFVDCYAMGTVTGRDFAGGLIGSALSGDFVRCFSASRISGNRHIGGFVAFGSMRTTASFWDAQINDGLNDADATGRTTAEMQDPNMFVAAGWDFVSKPDGPSDIWAEPAGGGYPILWWQLPELPEFPFSGGTGTADDPYLIATAEQLNSIGHNPRLMHAHLKVTNDIDLSGLHFYLIGNEDYAFEGVFDGGGFAISNFTYTAVEPQDVGLFRGLVGNTAEVRNVRLVNPVIDAPNAKNVGSLMGRLWRGTMRDCHAEGGRVSGGTVVGGLVGHNGIPSDARGSILAQLVDCSASTTVVGQSAVGGLVGMNVKAAMVSDCYADCNVNGQLGVGGLAGVNHFAIINSRSAGTIVGTRQIGGLVGFNGREYVRRSFSTANVQGDTQVGGLVGVSCGTITDCYAIATVTGEDEIGGLVGQNGYIGLHSSDPGTITNCYSASRLSGTQNVGGLVGRNELGATTASFWDRDAGGLRIKSGKTTSEMQIAGTFLSAGWDFVDETQNGTEDIWWILEGQDYPRLSWERDTQP